MENDELVLRLKELLENNSLKDLTIALSIACKERSEQSLNTFDEWGEMTWKNDSNTISKITNLINN